jgi:hypothetical protein
MTKHDLNYESSAIIHRHLAILYSEYKLKTQACMDAVVAMEDSDFADTDLGNAQLNDMYDSLEINESVTDKLESLVELFEKFL